MKVVLHTDFRKLGYCNSGLRRFAKVYGLDWTTFIKTGVTVEQLRMTGDSRVEEVIDLARKREANL